MDQQTKTRVMSAITLTGYPATLASFFVGLRSEFMGLPDATYGAFVLAYLGVVASTIVVAAVGSPSPGSSAPPGDAIRSEGLEVKQAKTYALLLGTVAVASVLLAVVLVLALVPVAHQTTSTYHSGQIDFVTTSEWVHPVPMSGFGQIVLNWTQSGAYGEAQVWMTGPSNATLFDQYTWTGTPGYGGLVVAPGTYVIHATAVSTIAVYLEVETASYSAAPII